MPQTELKHRHFHLRAVIKDAEEIPLSDERTRILKKAKDLLSGVKDWPDSRLEPSGIHDWINPHVDDFPHEELTTKEQAAFDADGTLPE